MAAEVTCDDLRNYSQSISNRAKYENRPLGAQVQLVLFYVENSLFVLFLLTFAFFRFIHPLRAKFARLHQRSLVMLTLTHLGASFASVSGSWYQAHPLDTGLPCWVYLLTYFLMVPCLTFPIVTRLLAFYRGEQWTSVVVSEQQRQLQDQDDTSSVAASDVTHTTAATNTYELMVAFVRVIFCRATTHDQGRGRKVRQISSSNMASAPETNNPAPVPAAPERGKRERMRALRFLKSKTGSYLTLGIIFLPYLLTVFVVMGVNQFVEHGCWGCITTKSEENVLIIESVFALLLLVISYRLNIGKKDPFGIVQEVRLIIWFGGAPAVLFLILLSALRPQVQGDFQFTMLIEISLIVYCFIQSALQCILAVVDHRKERHVLQQIQYSQSEFEELFLAKSGPFYDAFSKHVAAEHGLESLAFLASVFQWEKLYFDVGAKTSRARAKKIINMYVGENAELPCNLSHKCVELILKALAKPDAEIPFDFFKLAKNELVLMLYRDSFARFIRTKEFNEISERHPHASSKLTAAAGN